ncbi:MAG: DUF2490 domain-containing protein [Salinivirgaceae bacterium]|nr:DUF2490 domain-containing protein [Salinivirgaceae bacterium]
MNKSFCKLILLISFLCVYSVLNAQQKDFQSWNSVSIKTSLTNKISISGSQEIRLKNNASNLADYLTELGAEFLINKNIEIGGSYRLTFNKNLKDGNSLEHRYCFDVGLKYLISRFEVSVRERYQTQYSNLAQDDFPFYQFHHLRHKAVLAYDIPKSQLEPFAEIEFYQGLNNPISNGIEKNRYTLGLKSKITNYLSAEIYCRYQTKNNNISKSSEYYIVGTCLKISL